MDLDEQGEELYILSFNVGTVVVNPANWETYKKNNPKNNTAQPAVHAAIIDAVKKAIAAGKPPGAIALQEYKFADTALNTGHNGGKGLLEMLNKLDLFPPRKRPLWCQELEPRWVFVRQFGNGKTSRLVLNEKLKKSARNTLLLIDSWKYFITMSASHNPAVLPHTEKNIPEMLKATGEAAQRLESLVRGNRNKLRTVVKFEDRWAGVHLVVRDENGGPTNKQFLLISYHGRLRYIMEKEADETFETLPGYQAQGFIPPVS